MRGARLLPARRDIDPAAVRSLLPHIGLIERDQDFYRWRLMGTAIVADLGCDLTGRQFGQYIAGSEFIGTMYRTFEEVLAQCRPCFEESIYKKDDSAVHAVSRLLLPLADDAGQPIMILVSRLACFSLRVHSERNWLKGVTGKICATHPIDGFDDLKSRAMAWESANR